MTQVYSNPDRENDAHALPDIEVFQLTAAEVAALDDDSVAEFSRRHEFRLCHMNSRVREAMFDAIVAALGVKSGWYWQACFPGCLPDGEPQGPFASFAEAKADAQDGGV